MTTIVYYKRKLYTDGRHYVGNTKVYNPGFEQAKYQILDLGEGTVAFSNTGENLNSEHLQVLISIAKKGLSLKLEDLFEEFRKSKIAPFGSFPIDGILLYKNAAFLVENDKEKIEVVRLNGESFEVLGTGAIEVLTLWKVFNIPMESIMAEVSKQDIFTSPNTYILNQDELSGEAA